MKKLTTGIFTVLLGLVAVDASAAVTSKAYVDNALKTKQNTLTNAANGTATIAIDENGKISTTAAVATTEALNGVSGTVTSLSGRVDTAETNITGLQGTVGNTTAGLVKDVADLQESMKNVATTEGLKDLQDTVDGHTTALGTLNGAAETAGSVANSIATALAPYSTSAQVDTKISDATSTLATKAEVTEGLGDKQDKSNAAYSFGTAAGGWQALTPAQISALDSGATKATIDSVTDAATGLAATRTLAQQGVDDAAAAQETANAAIPKPTGECANPTNKCVLTFNNSAYAWEVIERAAAGDANAGE